MVQLFTSTINGWQNIRWSVAYAMATSLTGAAAACASRVTTRESYRRMRFGLDVVVNVMLLSRGQIPTRMASQAVGNINSHGVPQHHRTCGRGGSIVTVAASSVRAPSRAEGHGANQDEWRLQAPTITRSVVHLSSSE